MQLDDALANIWAGDRLNRREEAVSIERFLQAEVEEMTRQGREHSYVLAIDAPYGVGKTFFLDRFIQQLRLRHPVAHFDAWVDDANEEPLVAIMAAIENALKPYMTTGASVGKKFKAATAAALPIIGKAVTGASTSLAKKWLGEGIGDAIGVELTKAASGPASTALDAAVDGAKDEIETLIDREAQQMLDAYQRRRQSRDLFKKRMRALIGSIDDSDNIGTSPLFIVVDELDRCRPDFAIRVLEEIKHFFDIPGVVFVLAVHGEQLSKSIAAVYGAEFDSGAYLRRFFSRKYALRQPSLVKMVKDLFDANGLSGLSFSYPPSASNDPRIRPVTIGVFEFCALYFTDHFVTSREVIAIVDMIRVFKRFWKENREIELPLLLSIILYRLRDRDWRGQAMESRHGSYMSQAFAGEVHNFTAANLLTAYINHIHLKLPDVQPNNASGAADRYVLEKMATELQTVHGGQWQTAPHSLLLRYADTVEQIFPFALPTEDQHTR